jgi:hypothetical protein
VRTNQLKWRLVVIATSTLMMLPPPAGAQTTACKPPLKFAAGACVVTCPGGYEDRGRECVYRSQR